MLISQQAAADEIGISKQALNKRIEKAKKSGKHLDFVKKNKSGISKIDNEHPHWKMFKTNYAANIASAEMKKRGVESTKKKKDDFKGFEVDTESAQEKINKKKSLILRMPGKLKKSLKDLVAILK